MLRAWLVLTTMALLAAQPPPSGQQRFRSSVNAVRVDVLAMDDRRPITGLTAADFELRDNGVVQDIQLVDTQELPLGIVCALDVSDSVAGPVLDALTLG